MDLNPLNFTEIDAFARLNHLDLHYWEVEALEELDEAVRRAWNPKNKRLSSSAEAAAAKPEQIPITDVAGIKSLMRTMKIKKASQIAARESRTSG